MEKLYCLLNTPALCISYDADNKWLYNQWRDVHNSESIRLAAEHIFICLAEQPCTKILSDHSLLQGDWRPAALLVVRRNFERLTKHGVLYVAWVCSLSYDDRVAMDLVLHHTAHPIVSLFDDVASAYDWLIHCPDVLPVTGGAPLRMWAV